MNLFLIICSVLVCANDSSVFSAVVLRRRPVFDGEPVSKTTTPGTTTSTAAPIPESITISNRLSRLTLPSNATSIRSDITDNFSCNDRIYGYYADVENDCQIFHVCLPVTYPDGKEQEFRWSFICPEETTFNQEAFICVRTDEMPFDCSDSVRFYDLNRNLGLKDELITEDVSANGLELASSADAVRTGIENKHELAENRRKIPIMSETTNTPPQYTSRPSLYRIPVTRKSILSTLSPSSKVPNTESTEKTMQTTNYFNEHTKDDMKQAKLETVATVVIDNAYDTTTFSPNFDVDSADWTTEQSSYETDTTENNVSEGTNQFVHLFGGKNSQSAVTQFSEYVTLDANTRIVPELIEVGNDIKTYNQSSPKTAKEQNKATDEVVESIKQLQNIVPTQNLHSQRKMLTNQSIEDPRRKRFLFKADSIKNRQRLFKTLNNK